MFRKEVGENVGHSGEEVERLMKNLQGDFQKIKQHLHLSGAGTSSPPASEIHRTCSNCSIVITICSTLRVAVCCLHSL